MDENIKANNTHISLETAKLFSITYEEAKKGKSFPPSEYFFQGLSLNNAINGKFEFCKYKPTTYSCLLPAYTWQEILWENAEEFFKDNFRFPNKYNPEYFENHTEIILMLLQQKKYQEADEYFRDNTILIKKQ